MSAQQSTGPVRVRSVCGQDVCSLEQGWLRESTPRGGTRELHTLRDGDHLQPRETSGQVLPFGKVSGLGFRDRKGVKLTTCYTRNNPPRSEARGDESEGVYGA